ncbi:MAG: serine/threonine protein kinase, partial [Rhodospirillales bacterium]|nr:serine/threonine protein kinase [Rhodospirillales bacterium]
MQPGLKVGDKLDQFAVVEQIGAGGSSIVWKGFDALLDRHVAIKQLFAGQDEMFRRRFREEAKVQRMLGEKHPYVVRLIDVIEDDRGMFLVTEFVDGPDLEQLLARRAEPMEVAQATKIMWAISLALQDLHEAGVVHRDLKPSNILLPKQGSGVRLCDLGLASLIAEQEALSLGSVRYMAPELFKGEAVDGRCDLYALGMIAYEMLVGRKVFASAFKTILRDERNQAMRWMKWHTNMRLSPPSPSQLNEEVPEKLSELVMRLLEKDRTKRVTSASELIEAMQIHFGHRAAEPAPQPRAAGGRTYAPAGDTAALPTKKKWPMLVAAVVLLSAIGVLGFLLVRDMQQESALEEQREIARQILREAEQADTDGNFEAAASLYREAAVQWPEEDEERDFVMEAEGSANLADVRENISDGALSAAEGQLIDLQ